MRKMTLLPKKMNDVINTMPEKWMRNTTKAMVFILFLSMLFMMKPVFAGAGSIFGYPDNTTDLYTYILSGSSTSRVLSTYFSTDTFNEVNHLSIISSIMNITAGVGMILVFIKTIRSVLSAGAEGYLTKEYMLKLLLIFVLPTVLIANTSIITDGVRYIGSFMKDTIIEETYGLTEEEVADAKADGKAVEEVAGEKTVANEELKAHVRELIGYKDGLEGEERQVVSEVYGTYAYGVFGSGPGTRTVFYNNGDIDVFRFEDVENPLVSYDADYSWLKTILMDACNFILQLLVIGIDIGICIGIMVACYGVLGRLIIYQSFLPISIADIGEKGIHSNGVKMIKQYIAVYLEIGLFYLINFIGWDVFHILAMKQETLAGLVITFLAGGVGIRTIMRGARDVAERLVGV